MSAAQEMAQKEIDAVANGLLKRFEREAVGTREIVVQKQLSEVVDSRRQKLSRQSQRQSWK